VAAREWTSAGTQSI